MFDPHPGVGVLEVKISTKVREMSCTAKKLIHFFNPPPPDSLGGVLGVKIDGIKF